MAHTSQIWRSILWAAKQAPQAQITVYSPSDEDVAQRLSQATVLAAAASIAQQLQAAVLQQQQRRSPGEQPLLVAVLLPRALGYVVAVLAALAAGAAFLPCDPGWPPHRLQQVLAAAAPHLLLHDADTGAAAAAAAAAAGLAACQLLLLADPLGPHLHCQVQQQQQQQQQQGTQLQQQQQDTQAQQDAAAARPLPWCYLMFTSGSTGQPVGVRGTEQGLLNRFNWQQQQGQDMQLQQQQQEQEQQAGLHPVALQPGDVVCFKTSVSFVDHLWELLAPFLAPSDMLLCCQAHNRRELQPDRQQQQALPPGQQQQQQQREAGADAGEGVGAVLPPVVLRPDDFVRLLVAHGVTHLVGVPSVVQLWLPALATVSRGLALKQLVCSGEPLPADLAARLLDVLPKGCALLNLYGSTEVSADVTSCVVTRELLSSCGRWVPAGLPISGMMLALLPHTDEPTAGATADAAAAADAANADGAAAPLVAPVALGAVGEVAVAGPGLAAGYLEPAAAAAAGAGSSRRARFQLLQLQPPELGAGLQLQQRGSSVAAGAGVSVASSFAEPRMWFRTGDLGRLHPDGSLQLLGRCDQTVKVAGVRVDLLEVEQVLLSQQHFVSHAAVRAWPHPQRPQDHVLAAYVVLRQQHADWQQQLREHAAARLPAAACPVLYQALQQLPRSAAGKLLRSELPRPPQLRSLDSEGQQQQQQQQQQDADAAAVTPAAPAVLHTAQKHSEVAVMAAMLAAAAAVRGSDPNTSAAAAAAAVVEPTDNFFTAAGGDSLAAAEVAARLGVDLRLVFAYPTARSLAAFLRTGSSGSTSIGSDGKLRPEQQQDAPPAKRRRLLLLPPEPPVPESAVAATAAAGQGSGAGGRGDSSSMLGLCEALSAASTVIHVAAASRCCVWHLPDVPNAQTTAVAAEAGAVYQAQQQQQQQHGQDLQQPAAAGAVVGAAGAARLSCNWRLPLGRCVDAAPLVMALLPPAASAAAPQQRQQGMEGMTGGSSSGGSSSGSAFSGSQRLLSLVAFACSHDGSVVCVDVPSGKRHWMTQLPARADAGLCCSPCGAWLAVPAGDDRVHCLAVADGRVAGCTACGGAVRAAPAADPWWGCCWLVTHARELLALQTGPRLALALRHPLPAAGSARVAFAATPRLAVVALLDGSVLALAVSRQHGPDSSMQLTCQQTWSFRFDAPVFSSPAVVLQEPAAGGSTQPSSDGSTRGVVVVAAVDGTIEGLELQTGRALWKQQAGQAAGGNVFADLLVTRQPASGSDGSAVAVVADQAGWLTGIRPGTGQQVWRLQCSSSSISAAPAVVAGLQELMRAAAVPDAAGSPTTALMVVASRDGGLDVAAAGAAAGGAGGAGGDVQVVTEAALPGEVFSSPVVVGRWVLLGCRDDCLYCLKLGAEPAKEC